MITDPAIAKTLGAQYLALTRSWKDGVIFRPAEIQAMRAGKQSESLMTNGLNDPIGKRAMANGDPSFDKLAALYPGKILDRTVLGPYSDPRRSEPENDDEFAVWFNGAIGANILRHKVPATTLTPAFGTNIYFSVGPAAEPFARDRNRLADARYEDGWLPIVRAAYTQGGVRYELTELHGAPDTLYVRFTARNTAKSARRAAIVTDVTLLSNGPAGNQNGALADQNGAIVALFDRPGIYDSNRHRTTHQIPLEPGASADLYLKVPYLPDASGENTPPTKATFDRAYSAAKSFWTSLIASGTQITTPEERINRTWRALLVQNFILSDGPRFTYGSGLRYNDSYYPFENGFGTHVFAQYGHEDFALGLLPYAFEVSVHPATAGRKYQNRRAMPLHHMWALYRLTGNTEAYHRNKADLYRVAGEILADRKSTQVLDAKGEKPWHWGLLPPDKPGVDLPASTQTVYVLGHSITNAQGLRDFGEFLTATGFDPVGGAKYTAAAKEFRDDILRAMRLAAIRVPGRPPFVDLQTLYFAKTPDYGPEPYDNIALGRLQGTYYQYWVNMQMQYRFFNPNDDPGLWMADYVSTRGGKVLGLTRARPRPDEPWGWFNAVYNSGYYNYRLSRNEIPEFLLGFYSRFAFAMSRSLYTSSEGSPLIGYNTANGGFVDQEHYAPNSASNSETLSMLRNMLVREDLIDNQTTGILHLLQGVPSAWLAAGKVIRVERAPTYYGAISFSAKSEAAWLAVQISSPTRPAIKLHIRRPFRAVTVNGQPHTAFDRATGVIDLPAGGGRLALKIE